MQELLKAIYSGDHRAAETCLSHMSRFDFDETYFHRGEYRTLVEHILTANEIPVFVLLLQRIINAHFKLYQNAFYRLPTDRLRDFFAYILAPGARIPIKTHHQLIIVLHRVPRTEWSLFLNHLGSPLLPSLIQNSAQLNEVLSYLSEPKHHHPKDQATFLALLGTDKLQALMVDKNSASLKTCINERRVFNKTAKFLSPENWSLFVSLFPAATLWRWFNPKTKEGALDELHDHVGGFTNQEFDYESYDVPAELEAMIKKETLLHQFLEYFNVKAREKGAEDRYQERFDDFINMLVIIDAAVNAQRSIRADLTPSLINPPALKIKTVLSMPSILGLKVSKEQYAGLRAKLATVDDAIMSTRFKELRYILTQHTLRSASASSSSSAADPSELDPCADIANVFAEKLRQKRADQAIMSPSGGGALSS